MRVLGSRLFELQTCAVAAISSEWWGGGVQVQTPGPEAEKKLNFDNTKPL